MDADHSFLLEAEEHARRFPFPGDFEAFVARAHSKPEIEDPEEAELLEDLRHRRR